MSDDPRAIAELVERVEKATGPDRALDNAVRLATNNGCAFDEDPAYTSSLDAAMTLAKGTNRSLASLMEEALGRFSQESYSSYLDDREALARFFTAACLRALLQEEASNG